MFLVFWIVIASFVTRFIGRRYLPDPRQGDIAAIGVAVLCAAGAGWYYGAHSSQSSTAVRPASTPGLVARGGAPAKAPGVRDTTAACRSIRGPFGRTPYGSIDLVRSIELSGATTTVADGGQMDRRRRYVVEGWAAESNIDSPAAGVCLLVDSKMDVRHHVSYGLPRPDVAAGFHNDALIGSGYRIEIAPGSLALGRHHLQVVSLAGTQALGIVPAERTVTVY